MVRVTPRKDIIAVLKIKFMLTVCLWVGITGTTKAFQKAIVRFKLAEFKR